MDYFTVDAPRCLLHIKQNVTKCVRVSQREGLFYAIYFEFISNSRILIHKLMRNEMEKALSCDGVSFMTIDNDKAYAKRLTLAYFHT